MVPGVSAKLAGVVEFDVDVSPDGNTLYVTVGHFNGGANPTGANLAIFDKTAKGFVTDPHSARILGAVNAANELNYAASISPNGLELFFTRASLSEGGPAIYRATPDASSAVRSATSQRVTAITGFAEAPSISADGTTLYYHKMVGTHFQIYTVTRP